MRRRGAEPTSRDDDHRAPIPLLPYSLTPSPLNFELPHIQHPHLAVVGAFNGAESLEQVILLPPVIVNGGLVYLFGRTLLPGREPLISDP